jgi:hypothetical protein
MGLVIGAVLITLVIGVFRGVRKKDLRPFGASILFAVLVGAFAMVIAKTAGEGEPGRYVLEETYALAHVDDVYATASLENGEVIIQFTYADKNGHLTVIRASVADVVVVVDPNAKPIAEIFRNRNGRWYALDEGSAHYWITIPEDTLPISIPTVPGPIPV